MKCGAIDQSANGPLRQQIAVIGYGNSLRRDDGAGIVLAEMLVSRWKACGIPARLITNVQLLPEMAEDLAREGVAVVIFIDTSAVSSPSMQVAEIEIKPVEIQPSTASTGHQLDPATLLLYTAMLYGHQPHAWLVTIPGLDFDHGEGFSPQVRQLLANNALVAATLLEKIQEFLPCMN